MNKRILIFLFFISLISNTSQSQTNLQQGLVVCLPFSGNANDKSGNGNNGTVLGATLAKDRFGNLNSAYYFDGNSYISVGNPSLFTNNSFTFSLWAKISVLPTDQTAGVLLSVGNSGADQDISLNINYLNSSQAGWVGGGYNSDGSNTSNISNSIPNLTDWYYVTFTRDITILKLYVNGDLKGTVSTNGSTTQYSSPAVVNIGRRSHLANNISYQYFNGYIDDVVIYNRTLSDSEIQKLYLNGLPCVQIALPSVNNTVVCGNNPATLTASGGTLYKWYDAQTGGNMVFEGNPFTTSVSTTTSFYVSAAEGNSESTRVKGTITVFPKPEIECNFPEKVGIDKPENYVVKVDSGLAPFTYNWDFGDSTTFTGTQSTVSHAFSNDGIYKVSVKVTDANNCEATCIKEVDIQSEIIIPNVFTPNGMVVANEIFTVFNKYSKTPYQGKKTFDMQIYNRYGKQIITTANVQKGWNGEGFPTGIYYYKIKLGNSHYKGWVNLLK